MADTFPFDEIGQEAVKIKLIPISFQWATNGGPEEREPEVGRECFKSSHPVIKGPTRQRPWFWPPLKVRIVPGILGKMPRVETHIVHQDGGVWEVRKGVVSTHRLLLTSPDCLVLPFRPQIGSSPNPNPSPSPAHPNPSPPKSKASLTKFVGHLWKGAPTMSFAYAVLSKPADTVRVTMNQGGGHRFYGQGCGSAGGGYS